MSENMKKIYQAYAAIAPAPDMQERLKRNCMRKCRENAPGNETMEEGNSPGGWL